MEQNPSKRIVRLGISFALVAAALGGARSASAEISIVKAGDWEVFSDGRISAFGSFARGDGFPVIEIVNGTDAMGNPTQLRTQPLGGGIDNNAALEIGPQVDAMGNSIPGRIESMRIRSGFTPGILGIGFRRKILRATALTGYFQFWSDIESPARRKYLPMPVDVRVGYVKMEGPWGSLTVGRQLTLFSRGAVEIDFLYGHGFALGNPVNLNDYGPTAGHIGTGVLGPGFAAGAVYATPSLAGLRLNLSVFDPVTLQGAYDRTEWARPEAEVTYDRSFGSVKLHLFANGAYQKVYRSGVADSGTTTTPTGQVLDNSSAAYGAGYGARVEVGALHVGVAGHYGQGLGLYYALETSDAAYSPSPASVLRKSDGYYLQTQLAFPKFDVNVGVGISRIYSLDGIDNVYDAATGTSRQSIIKYQLGMSAVFVYHITDSLHFDIDFFRAQFKWYLGEKQNVNFVNTGLTMVW